MSWFAFSLCSIFALAGAELTQQHLLSRAKHIDERTSAILTFVFQALLTVPFIISLDLAGDFFVVFRPDRLPWFMAVGLIGSCGMVFYLRSFKVQSISFSCIFLSWSAVVSSMLGIVFLAESLNIAKAAGIALVLLAIALVNFRSLRLEKNHRYALLAGLCFGVTYTLDKKIVLGMPSLVYMFWIFLAAAFFGTCYAPRVTLRAFKLATPADLGRIMASGLGYFLYNLCTFSAYRHGGEVGRVDAINNSQIFLIILVEYYWFHQKEGVIRKVSAALLAAAGVWVLGMGGGV